MIRISHFLAILGLCAIVSALPLDVYVNEFNNFKATYQIEYPTAEEKNLRFGIFRENYDLIAQHNELYDKGEASYKMGINRFTDMTKEEYIEFVKEQSGGGQPPYGAFLQV